MSPLPVDPTMLIPGPGKPGLGSQSRPRASWEVQMLRTQDQSIFINRLPLSLSFPKADLPFVLDSSTASSCIPIGIVYDNVWEELREASEATVAFESSNLYPVP
jgi:hypothetical protein